MQVYDLLTGAHKGELIQGKPMKLQPSDHMYNLNNIYFKIKAALVNMVFKRFLYTFFLV